MPKVHFLRFGAYLAGLGVLCLLAWPHAVHANSIPSASFYGAFPNMTSQEPSLSLPGSITGTEGCSESGAQCVTATLSIAPYADGTASVSGNGSSYDWGYGADLGQAIATFYVEVVGPTANEPVYLILSGSGSATATSDAVGNVYVATDALVTGGPTFHACVDPSDPTSGCAALGSSFSGVEDLTAYPGSYFDISVGGDGETQYGSSGSWSFTADPMVSFAPGFDSSGLSLEFSPDVGTISVPDPPAASLMLSGLGVLGMAGGFGRKRLRC